MFTVSCCSRPHSPLHFCSFLRRPNKPLGPLFTCYATLYPVYSPCSPLPASWPVASQPASQPATGQRYQPNSQAPVSCDPAETTLHIYRRPAETRQRLSLPCAFSLYTLLSNLQNERPDGHAGWHFRSRPHQVRGPPLPDPPCPLEPCPSLRQPARPAHDDDGLPGPPQPPIRDGDGDGRRAPPSSVASPLCLSCFVCAC